MKITSMDILGKVSTFQGCQKQFFKFSVVESCQLQHDKKNVIKTLGKGLLVIPMIFPPMPVGSKKSFKKVLPSGYVARRQGAASRLPP